MASLRRHGGRLESLEGACRAQALGWSAWPGLRNDPTATTGSDPATDWSFRAMELMSRCAARAAARDGTCQCAEAHPGSAHLRTSGESICGLKESRPVSAVSSTAR